MGKSGGSLGTSGGSLRTSGGSLRTSNGSLRTSGGSLRTSDGSLRTSGGSLRTSDGSLKDIWWLIIKAPDYQGSAPSFNQLLSTENKGRQVSLCPWYPRYSWSGERERKEKVVY